MTIVGHIVRWLKYSLAFYPKWLKSILAFTLPILRSVIAGPEMAELYAENDIYAVAAAQTEHIRSRPVHEGYNEVNTEMLNVLTELIMDTKIDAKEALDEFAEEANEILASY